MGDRDAITKAVEAVKAEASRAAEGMPGAFRQAMGEIAERAFHVGIAMLQQEPAREEAEALVKRLRERANTMNTGHKFNTGQGHYTVHCANMDHEVADFIARQHLGEKS